MKYKSRLLTTAFILLYTSGFTQYNFQKVDDWLNANVEAMGGRCVLMIFKDGKIVHSQTANNMNMRQKWVAKKFAAHQDTTANLNGYTPSTKIAIASCSKWLSAALVMTFVDEGKLKLTDTVGKYLPQLSVAGKGNITIAECLSHTTGIKAPPLQEGLKEMRNIQTMDEAMEDIAALPMEGEPGKVFHYSNTGLQIAGAVIEKISGKKFQDIFHERIAAPLDMQQTDFGNSAVALPAGGAYSSAGDYMHFVEMILNKGMYNGKRILSEQSVHEMQVNRLDKDVRVAYSPAEAGNFGYGFGEWVMETSTLNNLTKTVTSPGLFGSFPWVDNDNHYCAFLLTFYIKNDGRNERYKALKQLVDEAVK